jgi:large subunit ribosomal protein L10
VNRAEKNAAIQSMAEQFQKVPHVIVADFRGLSANQSADLRRKIRAAGGSYQVVKNRLARRAGVGTATEKLASRLIGPCGLASHSSDPVALAKVLTEFNKDNPQLRLVAGVVDGRDVVDAEGIKTLSKLPGLPGVRAQLLALIQTPASMLVRVLATPGTGVARALDARREKLGGGGTVEA